jgi:hypothetical protein
LNTVVLLALLSCFTGPAMAPSSGSRSDNLGFDWPAVIARKDEIVASWSKGKNETPAKLGIPVLQGKGVFLARMIFPEWPEL